MRSEMKSGGCHHYTDLEGRQPLSAFIFLFTSAPLRPCATFCHSLSQDVAASFPSLKSNVKGGI